MTVKIIEQISDVERIAETLDPVGRPVFCHEWLNTNTKTSEQEWIQCCHAVPLQLGIDAVIVNCDRYSKIKEIIEIEGEGGMNGRMRKIK